MTASPDDSPLPITISEAGRRLARLALDRDDVNRFAAVLPESAHAHRVTVAYEMPLLRIVTVGWAIAYFLAQWPEKPAVHQAYWTAVESFARELSDVSALVVGESVAYFDVIRERADTYVAAMAGQSSGDDPTAVIGPVFARVCGAADDVHVIMAGNRTFQSALMGTRAFLDAVTLAPDPVVSS